MKKLFLIAVLSLFLCWWTILGQDQKEAVNLLSLHHGTLPVIEPEHYGGWPAVNLLDDTPESGWACETGKIKDNVLVFEMISAAVIERFEFDNAHVDDDGAGAKDVTVEVSAASMKTGFETVLKASLANKTERQVFRADKAVSGRWLRLTIHSNHGSESWTELFSFRGYGVRPAVGAPIENISGTYDSSYSKFHVRQQGTALAGCYEFDQGLLSGAIEGRLMKINWQEGGGEDDRGPAIMVFADDGKSFRGYFWNAGNEKKAPAGEWEGKKLSADVGGCPHWAGSLGGEVKKKLLGEGRARVYGILFDLDSATIRPESKPVLDEVLGVLKGEPGWNITIEGHTDSTGSDSHNLDLSKRRADSVRAYLPPAASRPAVCRPGAWEKASRSPIMPPSWDGPRTAGWSWCENKSYCNVSVSDSVSISKASVSDSVSVSRSQEAISLRLGICLQVGAGLRPALTQRRTS